MRKALILTALLMPLLVCATGMTSVRPDCIYVSTFDAEDTAPVAEQTTQAAIQPDVTPAVEQTLSGLKIGIDPGHQLHANSAQEAVSPNGKATKDKVSSGTAGRYTRVAEHVVNLQIGLLLRDELQKKGATVVMTRETDDVDVSNIERAQMMNDAGVDICLRLHCNGSTDTSANGTQLFVKKTGEKAEESAQAAKIMIDCMCEKTGARNRGIVKNDNYTGLNWSTVPSILVEMGFMSNKREDTLLNDPDYQLKLVEGMTEGIEMYFGRTAQ